MDKIFYPSSRIEVIANGLGWSEGPLWINNKDDISFLVFSDTITNRIYKWEEGKGLFTVGKSIYLEDSGCYTNATHCSSIYEPGSNGLLSAGGDLSPMDLLACAHGERGILLLRENGTRQAITTHYKTAPLNSPNDLVFSPEGHLYFTDPHYGLFTTPEQTIHVPKELQHNGIYMIKAEYLKLAIQTGVPTAYVRLLENRLALPNGLAFSPDFSKIYVTSSERPQAIIYSYDVSDGGSLQNRQVFYNATDLFLQEMMSSNRSADTIVGTVDGLKVDIQGNVYSSGPGGVLILSSEGQLVGRLRVPDRPVSYVAFGGDGRLYITAKDLVLRIDVKSKPARIFSRK